MLLQQHKLAPLWLPFLRQSDAIRRNPIASRASPVCTPTLRFFWWLNFHHFGQDTCRLFPLKQSLSHCELNFANSEARMMKSTSTSEPMQPSAAKIVGKTGQGLHAKECQERTKGAGRRTRNLRDAVMLRPREVFELYGIPPSTISDLCRHTDPARRLPSTLIPGRGGRKGMRLINHEGLLKWLSKWSQ